MRLTERRIAHLERIHGSRETRFAVWLRPVQAKPAHWDDPGVIRVHLWIEGRGKP